MMQTSTTEKLILMLSLSVHPDSCLAHDTIHSFCPDRPGGSRPSYYSLEQPSIEAKQAAALELLVSQQHSAPLARFTNTESLPAALLLVPAGSAVPPCLLPRPASRVSFCYSPAIFAS